MSSPRSTSTSSTVAATHRPSRNKSSTTLNTMNSNTTTSNHGRPKRNKSSTSLSSHSGHHNVSFAHASSSSSSKRSGSGSHGHKRSGSGGAGGGGGGARKGGFDFGFTKLDAVVIPPRSPSPPTISLDDQGDDAGQTELGVEEDERDTRGRGREKSRAGSNSRSKSRSRTRSRSRSRSRDQVRKGSGSRSRSARRVKVVIKEDLLDEGNSWISNVDSPAVALRPLPLPSPPPPLLPPVQQKPLAVEVVSQKAPPRATFEFNNAINTPPSPQFMLPPPPPPQPPAIRPSSPPLHSIPTLPAAPAPATRQVLPAIKTSSLQSTIPFPTSTTVLPSALRRPSATKRKNSTSSLLTLASIRSISNLGGGAPLPPGFRRTSSTLVQPVVDRNTVGVGLLSSPTTHRTIYYPHTNASESANAEGEDSSATTRKFGQNGRSESVTSLRSISEAIRPGLGGRASTMGMGEAREMSRRLREANETLSSNNRSSSMADLRSFVTTSTPGAGRKGTSGYLSSLRELAIGASAILTGAASHTPTPTTPVSPLIRSRLISSTSMSSTSSSQPGSSLPHYIPQQPLISKFIEPLDATAGPYLATPPTVLHALPSMDNNNYVAGGNAGVMSRTQQKGLLARDHPSSMLSSSSSALALNLNGGGGIQDDSGRNKFLLLHQYTPPAATPISSSTPTPSSATSSAAATTASIGSKKLTGTGESKSGMQKWATGLIREAERIERGSKAGERWRDLVGESLERVLFNRNGSGNGIITTTMTATTMEGRR